MNASTRVEKRNTGILSVEKDARNAKRDYTLVSPLILPRGSCKCGANVGRLLAPGCVARLPDLPGQWHRKHAHLARYSGGAAPALNRFPCPAFAISCSRESISVADSRQALPPTPP